MSIKGITQELFVGKTEVNIMNLIGSTTTLAYSNLKKIEYDFASKEINGRVIFYKKTNEEILFKFNLNANDQILKMVDFLKGNVPELPVSEMEFLPPKKSYPLEKKQEAEILTLDQLPEKQQELQMRIQLENLKAQQGQLAIQQQQLQMQRIQYDSMIKCPKCGSTSITGQKKGYGVVKGGLGAAALGAVTGGVGAIIGLGAGNIGRKKIQCTCMNCGYRFKAGSK